jgi:hypothetical protein
MRCGFPREDAEDQFFAAIDILLDGEPAFVRASCCCGAVDADRAAVEGGVLEAEEEARSVTQSGSRMGSQAGSSVMSGSVMRPRKPEPPKAPTTGCARPPYADGVHSFYPPARRVACAGRAHRRCAAVNGAREPRLSLGITGHRQSTLRARRSAALAMGTRR